MWSILALTFAFFSSINTIIYKKILQRTDEYVVAWASNIFGLPVLALITLLVFSYPRVDQYFWLGILGTVSLNLIASVLVFRSIKISQISLIAPLAAFNPLFTTFFAFLFLKERPNFQGLIGTGLIILGAYLLNLQSRRDGFLAPFKKLFSHYGMRLSLICNFLWGITPIFEKLAIRHTWPQSPTFVSLTGSFFLALFLFPVMIKKSCQPFQQIKSQLKFFLLIGFLGGLAAAAAFTVYNLIQLGYGTAVFKTSMIFTILWGHLFFKEKNIKERLLGAAVMLSGVILLVT